MSDFVEISVADQELRSLDDDLRPIFQPGSTCTVPQCGPKQYASHNTFTSHWKKFHTKTVNIFKCEMCCFRNINKSQITRHYKLFHHIQEHQLVTLTDRVACTQEHNKNFTDPGNSLCFKVDKKSAKEKASTKRKLEAEKTLDDTLSLFKEETDCRDEIVNITHGKKSKCLNKRWMPAY